MHTPLSPAEALLRPALTLFIVLSIITGLMYPLLVTGIAQGVWPQQALGSLIHDKQGHRIGSSLIGQHFSEPKYFWGRPSATTPEPYNAAASTGSNLGPANPALHAAVQARISALRQADPSQTGPVPIDLVTTSGSGLDPEMSLAAARYQASRIARVRGLPLAQVQALIDAQTRWPWLVFLGEPRVNVLQLNLALDTLRS